jgi:hypothetical protein
MRLFLEIIVAAALIALAWKESLHERARQIPWLGDKIAATEKSPNHPQSSTLNPRPVTTPATTAASPKAFTGHIYYKDEQGKSYWLDAQGKRHYEP